MIQQSSFRHRYTCGEQVKGHARQISTRNGQIVRSGKEFVIERGVIVMLPAKHGEPYQVLDEQSFIVLAAEEEKLISLS